MSEQTPLIAPDEAGILDDDPPQLIPESFGPGVELYTAPSTLGVLAGNGLFTKHAIGPGERIVTYHGKVISEREQQRYLDRGVNLHSSYRISRNWIIEASDPKSGFGRYANDAEANTKTWQQCQGKNNTQYKLSRTKDKKVQVWLTTCGKKGSKRGGIPPGGEVFVSYGGSYWRFYEEKARQERELAQQSATGTSL